MKKILIFSLVITLFASCSKEYTHLKVIDLQADVYSWQYSNDIDNNFYFVGFNVPEITDLVYNSGIVSMSIEYWATDGSNFQTSLPNVRHFEAWENGNLFLWTRTIDFEYYRGGVSVFVTNSDFVDERPGNMRFLLKLIW
ncbi:MAG: hypothetical protein LBT04_05020 [Prevotellaceae bacterium]|jgi:hypothetical protein|nr:hypothetical protein [Prevotellaceae bacterium]